MSDTSLNDGFLAKNGRYLLMRIFARACSSKKLIKRKPTVPSTQLTLYHFSADKNSPRVWDNLANG